MKGVVGRTFREFSVTPAEPSRFRLLHADGSRCRCLNAVIDSAPNKDRFKQEAKHDSQILLGEFRSFIGACRDSWGTASAIHEVRTRDAGDADEPQSR